MLSNYLWAFSVIFALQNAVQGNKYGCSLFCCTHTLAANLVSVEIYSLYVIGVAWEFVTNKNTELFQRALRW